MRICGTDPFTVTTVYDRRGRTKTLTQGTAVTALTYNDANEVLTEAYTGSGTTLNGLTVTSGYDAYLRRSTLALNSATALNFTYGYDTASRLSTVSDGVNNATYSYLANSPLVSTLTFKQNTTPRMTTTKNYDFLNRLGSISSAPSGSGASPLSYSYSYNDANQRTRRSETDNSYWSYEYDSLGQVKRGAKYFSDGSPVPGQQFEYGFDDIGNRQSTKAGGDENGANLRLANYTPNNLNQYSSRTVPGAFDVIGLAMGNNSTLTVNSVAPWRKGEYFRRELTVVNTSVPVWQSVSVAATGETTATGNVFVPKTAEAFGYDLDGNLTSDGRWTYTWDAENRLVKVESLTTNPTASKRRVTWEYDAKGRRIRQTTYNGSSGSFVVTEDLKIVSDGWRHIAELNAANNALVRSYVWGLDLSGSMDGAGGVGGLLMINSVANGTHFYAYDGNGNTAALIKTSDGTVSQICEYDPFGNIIRNTGLMADENRFLFSTKRCDRTTDLELYEYRVRRTDLAWLNRDPIGEIGFEPLLNAALTYGDAKNPNLYAFVANDPISSIDFLGLAWVPATSFSAWKPPHLDKPCCCTDPTTVTAKRKDLPPTVNVWTYGYTLHYRLVLTIKGTCYEDLMIEWTTCWRGKLAGLVGTGLSADVSVSPIPGIGNIWVTDARVFYLLCEGGKWTKKRTDAALGYVWTGWDWSH